MHNKSLAVLRFPYWDKGEGLFNYFDSPMFCICLFFNPMLAVPLENYETKLNWFIVYI